ncbi:MAG: glycoside hydrolase family 3 N-terminal domain-containing protein [Mycobacterium sp.]|nr:glycoside hydrolase family 3 N-terminal domain-containing protein [Mycobacterium sp.]
MPSVRMDKRDKDRDSRNDPPRSRLRSPLVLAAAAAVIVVALAVAAVMSKPRPIHELPTVPDYPPATPAAAPCRLNTVVNGLSLRQKLAQLLMVGVTNLDDAQTVVRDQEVGGIFIGSWTDLDMLRDGSLHALQTTPRLLPLAVSVDEEGGRVQRLKAILGEQLSARELVRQGIPPEQVQALARDRGRKMKDLGITIDFAPVVDVTDAPANTVIGDRSFGSDPDVVTRYGGAYAQGLREAGLLPVLKHFPGHGRASGDSHKTGVTTPPLSELATSDLVPYRTLTTAAPVGVMIGHMQVPELTGTDPASLSTAAYDLLRSGNYGAPPFTGPIFTDDLSSMAAITERYSVPDAVLKALQAGADTALWITTKEVPAVLDRLQQAVDAHELTEARIDDAVHHMAVAKDPSLVCTR